jgi:hypothetical protein
MSIPLVAVCGLIMPLKTGVAGSIDAGNHDGRLFRKIFLSACWPFTSGQA